MTSTASTTSRHDKSSGAIIVTLSLGRALWEIESGDLDCLHLMRAFDKKSGASLFIIVTLSLGRALWEIGSSDLDCLHPGSGLESASLTPLAFSPLPRLQ